MSGLKRLARMLNEPPLRPNAVETSNRPLWQLFGRYFMARHWPSVLIAVILASMGGLTVYGYAWAGRVIADDVVQVQLNATDRSAAEQLDATLPGERRLFGFDESNVQAALNDRLDAKTGRTVHQKMRLLATIAILLILMEIGRHVIHFVSAERLIYVGQKVQFQLRQNLHAKLLNLPMSYHDRHSPGRLLTHLFSDVNVIRGQMNNLIRSGPNQVLTMIVGIVIVLVINAKLAVLVLVALPAYTVAYRWFRTHLRVVNANLREREGRLNAHIANRIGHFLLVKSFVRENREVIDFVDQAKPIVRDNVAAAILNSGFSVVCGIITGICMTAVLWLGTLRVRDGQMSLGELLMFYAAAGYLFRPAASLTAMAGRLHRLRTVAGRVMRVLDEPITLSDPDEPLPTPTKACELRFEHVTMRYETPRTVALDDVNFTLPAGKHLCVMGPSGSGKTTLAKLVSRLYDPSEGRVLFDGIDVRRFKIADLCQLVGFVAQEPTIFTGTIGDNIRYGSQDAPHRDVVGAARYAQIHDFIDQLPQCYQTLTYEGGSTLSGGQRQRVTLARALLHDPKILAFDDCTSALDAQTEAQLIDAFQDALKDRTAVLISHRVSIATECDLVMMMDRGRIIEFGPPDDLLHNNGPFRTMYHEQYRGLAEGEPLAVAAPHATI